MIEKLTLCLRNDLNVCEEKYSIYHSGLGTAHCFQFFFSPTDALVALCRTSNHVHWDSALFQRTQRKTTTCFVWPHWNSISDKIHGAFTTMSVRWHRTIKALKTFLSSSEVEIVMMCPHNIILWALITSQWPLTYIVTLILTWLRIIDNSLWTTFGNLKIP